MVVVVSRVPGKLLDSSISFETFILRNWKFGIPSKAICLVSVTTEMQLSVNLALVKGLDNIGFENKNRKKDKTNCSRAECHEPQRMFTTTAVEQEYFGFFIENWTGI